MKTAIFTAMIYVLLSYMELATAMLWNRTCGIDLSKSSKLYEGDVSMEHFPWMGTLYYPGARYKLTTAVVLVTKQMVIAAAMEIDRLSKRDFRAKCRVVLGQKCGQNEIAIRDYNYHPEFYKGWINTLALVQLETDHVKQELRPICAPFAHFINPEFYTMTISSDCHHPKLSIYKMRFVETNQCMDYYRRSGLGFGIYGPGCGAPSRFIDFGKYSKWVQISTSTVGRPAVTRLDSNFIVLRRSFSSVQRFGPCDFEETEKELYTDKIQIIYKAGYYKSRYNITILENVEYSCVVFKARPLLRKDYASFEVSMSGEGGKITKEKPLIRLKRWCSTPTQMCHGFQFIEIQFFVEILFSGSVELQVFAYGKSAKIVESDLALILADHDEYLPRIPDYEEVIADLKSKLHLNVHRWFHTATIAEMYTDWNANYDFTSSMAEAVNNTKHKTKKSE